MESSRCRSVRLPMEWMLVEGKEVELLWPNAGQKQLNRIHSVPQFQRAQPMAAWTMILGTISRWWERAVEELPHLIVDRKPWERQGLGPRTAFIVTPQRTPKVGERAPFSCLFHNLRKEQDRVRRQVLKTPDYRGRFPFKLWHWLSPASGMVELGVQRMPAGITPSLGSVSVTWLLGGGGQFSSRMWSLVNGSCSSGWSNACTQMGSTNWTQCIIKKRTWD